MRPLQRTAVAAAVFLLAVGATPDVAGADPAEPTSDRSTVERIEPPVDGVEIRVVGGDSFLELEVERGHEVIVPGYSGEPYLRVHRDGVVEQNLRSPATYLNEDRFGDAPTPSGMDADDEPVWEKVAGDGTYAWHDHRIHWMSPDRPPGLSAGDVIQEWEVPLTVDGIDIVAHGTLVWEEPISPLPWLALIGVAAAATFAVARGRSIRAAAVLTLVAAVVATAVAYAERLAVPVGAGIAPVAVVVAGVAALAAIVALTASAVRRHAMSAIAVLISIAATTGWVLLRTAVFLEPVLPTDLDPSLDRAGTALAAGICIGSAIIVIRSDALAPPASGEG